MAPPTQNQQRISTRINSRSSSLLPSKHSRHNIHHKQPLPPRAPRQTPISSLLGPASSPSQPTLSKYFSPAQPTHPLRDGSGASSSDSSVYVPDPYQRELSLNRKRVKLDQLVGQAACPPASEDEDAPGSVEEVGDPGDGDEDDASIEVVTRRPPLPSVPPRDFYWSQNPSLSTRVSKPRLSLSSESASSMEMVKTTNRSKPTRRRIRIECSDSEDEDVMLVSNRAPSQPRQAPAKLRVSDPDDDQLNNDDSVVIMSKSAHQSSDVCVVSRPTSQLSPPSHYPKKRKLKRVLSDEDSEMDDDGDWNVREGQKDNDDYVAVTEEDALQFFNTCDINDLPSVTTCTLEQAQVIASLRPFSGPGDLKTKLKKKKGISSNVLSQYQDMMKGYIEVDRVLTMCERHGDELSEIMNVWAGHEESLQAAEGAVDLVNLAKPAPERRHPAFKGYLFQQPTSIPRGMQLKAYQLLGLNWLNLLYSKKISCILADEMGLGKTAQVVSFLSHLKQVSSSNGSTPQHLVIVPASTLDNWVREFRNFSTNLAVRAYYGSQAERAELRYELKLAEELDVVITTYGVATGSIDDRKFLEKMRFDSCVYDEGHQLKNSESKRYKDLMRMKANWRLLLTGTPLQNNLTELVSLLSFILPKIFENAKEDLKMIFKVRADAQVNLLAQTRVTRAKKMMTPFVLRRKKAQVLNDLPRKIEKLVYCEMVPTQRLMYKEILRKSKKYIMSLEERGNRGVDMEEEEDHAKVVSNELLGASQEKVYFVEQKRKTRRDSNHGLKEKFSMTTNNVVMDLRKAAIHPMLFRKLFDDKTVVNMSRACLKELEFHDRDPGLIAEDMDVMNDYELHVFATQYNHLRPFALQSQQWMDSGKIKSLVEILKQCQARGSRVLIFSQFTQMLSILELVLKTLKYKFLILTGSTSVSERQPLVDKFTKDESISVFLLSTRAGGLGLNLMAADTVIIFDQDFNPHNDRQAEDRAYRLGQKKDVKVIKLITKNTIEEDILQLASNKIALDMTISEQDGKIPEVSLGMNVESAEVVDGLALSTKNRTKNRPGQAAVVVVDDDRDGQGSLALPSGVEVVGPASQQQQVMMNGRTEGLIKNQLMNKLRQQMLEEDEDEE